MNQALLHINDTAVVPEENSEIPIKPFSRVTQKILNWLNNPLAKDKDPILMLTGNPGFGKSVILKDTLALLLKENIPAIETKAKPATKINDFEIMDRILDCIWATFQKFYLQLSSFIILTSINKLTIYSKNII